MKRTDFLGTVAAALVLLIGVGCGGGDDDDSSSTTSTTSNNAGGGGTAGAGGGSAGSGGAGGQGGAETEDEIHDCLSTTAMPLDDGGQIIWQNPHTQNKCVRVNVGTTINWIGNFVGQPLIGGVAPDEPDNGSPISMAEPMGMGTMMTLSVTFDETPTDDFIAYPYFCMEGPNNECNAEAMQGVVYVFSGDGG